MGKGLFSFFAGFAILFAVYHFPEFFPAFWIMAVFKIGFLPVAFACARLQGWKGLGGYGLGLENGWVKHLLKGLLTGIIFFSLSVLASILLGYEQITDVDTASILQQLPLLLLMTVFPSIAEDILTRGYLYGHLSQKMKPALWILVSAAVYVLNHIWRLNDDLSVLTYLFILGLVLALVVWQTKALWLAFGIHWGANIAFECSHSFMKIRPVVTHPGSTWLLASSWLISLLLLFYQRKR